ncbi:IS3 family transposase [Clostridium sp. FP2]|uniref:IS3 family transposase n=1 Tax=Clostridium sp. FP2 TaxID=2724481 RepID=UPI001CCE2C1C|nr:IS3 family transposase [Clostridium sp. FP2]MBZ9625836.1 IS3 family transposase [Clostridium sp. FP2]
MVEIEKGIFNPSLKSAFKISNYFGKSVDEYIIFYNTKRLQKRLNGLSPMEYRTLAA